MESNLELPNHWTPQTIHQARTRWSTLQSRTNLTFQILCPTLNLLTFLTSRYYLPTTPIPIFAYSPIWATWYFVTAMLEILVHTGVYIRIPVIIDKGERWCVVEKIFPNEDARLSVLVEGHERTWPREREEMVEWWRRGLSGRGWEAAPEGKWFGGGVVGAVYVVGMVVLIKGWSGLS